VVLEVDYIGDDIFITSKEVQIKKLRAVLVGKYLGSNLFFITHYSSPLYTEGGYYNIYNTSWYHTIRYNKIYDDKSCKYDDKRYVICIVMCHSVSGDMYRKCMLDWS